MVGIAAERLCNFLGLLALGNCLLTTGEYFEAESAYVEIVRILEKSPFEGSSQILSEGCRTKCRWRYLNDRPLCLLI